MIEHLGEPGKLVIGGKSLGGRIASMIADEAGVAGLICLGYPFHPPGKPDRLRTAHLIELRTAPAGHPSYRRVCQEMHRLIAGQAGHHAIADAMKYVDHSEVDLERLESEKAAEKRRAEHEA